MKHSSCTQLNKNLKALVLMGFLFLGSTSFAQTMQVEPIKAAEPKTELSEYPTDPVIVPADLKKHAIEQTKLAKSIPVKADTPKKTVRSHVCPSF